MITLHILSGPPASGKSTYAAAQDGTVLSRDAFRAELRVKYNNTTMYFPLPAEQEYSQWIAFISDAIYAAQDGDHLYIDQTTCSCGSFRKLLHHLRHTIDPFTEKVVLHIFDTPLDVCLALNANRTGIERVPDKVIESFHKQRMLRAGFTPEDTHRALQVIYPNLDLEIMPGSAAHAAQYFESEVNYEDI